MNKTVKYILCILAVILGIMLSSCKSEEPISKNKNELITIHVGMPAESETRVLFDDENLKLTWEKGDKIGVVGHKKDGKQVGVEQEYELISGFGTASGTFQGKPIPEADYYGVYYKIELDENVNEQKQISNNSTKHLGKHLILMNEKVDNLTAPFQLKIGSSIMKLVLTDIPPLGNLVSLKWQSKTVGLFGEEEPFERLVKLENSSLNLEKNSFTAYFCFDISENPNVKENSDVKVTLQGSEKKYESTVISTNGKNYTVGKRYTLRLSNWKEVK